MSEKIIVDNEFVTLKYFPELKLLRHKFHKAISGQSFRSVLDRGIEVLIETGAVKWLSDDRENMAFPDDDNKWINESWIPRALEAGWKYWALVVPNDMLARVNMSGLIENLYDRGLRMMVSSDPEDALKWITSVK